MADLKTSATSDYPTSLDTFTTIVDSDTRSATPMNGLADASVKIETALGTNPQSLKADIKSFLQAKHNTDGTHNRKFGTFSCDGLTSQLTETVLGSILVPANTIVGNNIFRVNVFLKVLYVDAPTISFWIRFGNPDTITSATICFSALAFTPVVDGGNYQTFFVELNLWRGASSSDLISSGSFIIGSGGSADGASQTMNITTVSRTGRHYNISEDTTINQRLWFSYLYSGTSSNNVLTGITTQKHEAYVENID